MKIIIVGCGRWGAGLAQLLGQRGHVLTVIDRDEQSFARLASTFKGRTLVGPALSHEALYTAGIERADGLAALTGSDEVNVVVGRVARQIFQVPKVVARLYDPGKAEIYRRLGLQTVAPVAWGINRVAEILSYSEQNTLVSLNGDGVELIETEVPALMVGRTVDDLEVPSDLKVVAIRRQGKTFLAMRGTAFEAGDRIYVAILAASASRLHTLLAAA
jgi:trk system potassium uptake protein TrkA